MGDPVSDGLATFGTMTKKAVQAYLRAAIRTPSLDEPMAVYPNRGGKMLRPSICLAAAGAVGGVLSDCLGAAASIDLLHNATLVHDDIEDDSATRRGGPALHQKYGIPLALNAGDALFLLSLRPLLAEMPHLGSGVVQTVIAECERMAWETVEGQAIELGWMGGSDLDLTETDYFVMAGKKTAWPGFIYPARLGILVATRGGGNIGLLDTAAFHLGVAFQIADDVADFEGGDERSLHDLIERKRSLAILHGHRTGSSQQRADFEHFMALRPPEEKPDEDEAKYILSMLKALGSVDYAKQIAVSFAGIAADELHAVLDALPATQSRGFLLGLPEWILSGLRPAPAAPRDDDGDQRAA